MPHNNEFFAQRILPMNIFSHIEANQIFTPPPAMLHQVTEEIVLPKGLIGFYDLTRFLLHYYQDSDYVLLESIEDSDIRFFLCALPWDFYPSEDIANALISENIDAMDDALYAIVKSSDKAPTINLRAPLVKKDKEMWQVVMHQRYALDYSLEAL